MALFFFLLTKETLATCQLLTLLLFKDRLFYSASLVCSSFSAAACAFLQALRISPQHQQVYRFSFLSCLLSPCPWLRFPLLRSSYYLTFCSDSGRNYCFFFTARLQWVPTHTLLPYNYTADELSRRGAMLQQSTAPCSLSLGLEAHCLI